MLYPNSIFQRTSVCISTGEDLGNVAMVYDGATIERPGNFIGIYGAINNPLANKRGNFWWYAAGGDHGDCHTEEEAQKEIADTWYGRGDDICPDCGGPVDDNGECDFIREQREE